uniref:FLYWCH-type domain-containing protein n=1 Tax=Latimeria chalumnae TaxID=7897 RepID=H3AA73_LATCH
VKSPPPGFRTVLLHVKIIHMLSQKGKEMIIYEGYSYQLEQILADGHTKAYCCPNKKCNGRVRLCNEDVHVVTEHSHGPKPEENEVRALKCAMKQQAEETDETPRQIIQRVQENISRGGAAIAPSYRSLQRTIEQRRKAIEIIPQQPADIRELQIPAHFCQTINGRPFLLHDSGPDDENRFVMFFTEENIECLIHYTNWFSDRTFRVDPLNFNQLYIIHASIEGSVLPMVYILMKNRTENSYRR